MKRLFVALLVINVLVFVWSATKEPEGGRAQRPPIRLHEGAGLVLLDETPLTTVEPRQGEALAAADPMPIPTVVQTQEPLQCWQLRGLTAEGEAQEVVAELKGLGPEIRYGYDSGQRTSYWVLVPPVDDPPIAAKTAADIRSLGIKDVYVIESGKYRNAVSLGVFSAREDAEARFRAATAGGSQDNKPILKTVELPVRRYWVEVPGDDVHVPTLRKTARIHSLSLTKDVCR